MRTHVRLLACALGCVLACSGNSPPDGDPDGGATGPCSVAEQTGCAKAEVCEEIEGASPRCLPMVAIEGKVTGALDGAGVPAARIVVMNADGAAVESAQLTSADGSYTIRVRAKRAADGMPLPATYHLRVDAPGFQAFPAYPRVAIPIDVSTATGSPPVVRSDATDVSLVPLRDTAGLGGIAGRLLDPHPGGTVVVAGGASAIADAKGAFEIFNVRAGPEVVVQAYAAGKQYPTKTVAVTAGTEAAGVDLTPRGAASAMVSGLVRIDNGGAATQTTALLVPEETFDPNTGRGDTVPFLSASVTSSAFSIAKVPDGRYVVLVGFENDGLVRDPNTSVAGNEVVHIEVHGQEVSILQELRVTGAVRVISPGASGVETVSGTPTFTWADVAGEDHYELRLYDALGTVVWEDLAVPPVAGDPQVSVTYGGPALLPGMPYQFRAVAIKRGGSPISITEDLLGAFVYR